METIIGATLKINNMPNDTKDGFMVVRNCDAELWYYGLYDTEERALQAALEIGNGFVVKV